MSSMTALILVMVLLLTLLVTNVPVALALAGAGTVGIILLSGTSVTSKVLGTVPYNAVASYSLLVIPMFILLGMFALRAGLASDLFGITAQLLRWLPGGMGIATVASCAGFAAVTGSSIATVATLGKMSITEMSKRGYSKNFAAAIVAAGGTLGVLIPPSIILVIYGILTMESIGSLLIAGIIPGILSAFAYALMVFIRIKMNPSLIATIPAPAPHSRHDVAVADDAGAPVSIGGGISAIVQISILFFVVIGGIYSGVATATESGALAALIGAILVIIRHLRQRGGLLALLRSAIEETVALTSMCFAILIGAGVFTYFLVVGGIPSDLSRWVVSLDLPPTLVVLVLVLTLLPLGMFLDSLSICVIMVPLIYQPIMELGFDGIWLGIIVVKLIEIGMITPPVGVNAYIAAGSVPGLATEKVFGHLVWFVIADLAVVAALFVFPAIVTWLPGLSGA